MSLRINQTVPDFEAETSDGPIKFHDWIGDSWAILFSHPKDFTPVCTTEFGAVAQLADEWEKRGVKVIGISVDGVDDHNKWKADIEAFGGAKAGFPIIADGGLEGCLPSTTRTSRTSPSSRRFGLSCRRL
ncbi:MAG: redoxin domain-containing protein, partial [Pseudomonadota bacterium]